MAQDDKVYESSNKILYENSSNEITNIIDRIKLYLHTKGIYYSTIQIEFYHEQNKQCREPVCVDDCLDRV